MGVKVEVKMDNTFCDNSVYKRIVPFNFHFNSLLLLPH